MTHPINCLFELDLSWRRAGCVYEAISIIESNTHTDASFLKQLRRNRKELNLQYGYDAVIEVLAVYQPFYEDSQSGLLKEYLLAALEAKNGGVKRKLLVDQYHESNILAALSGNLLYVAHPNPQSNSMTHTIQVSVWSLGGGVLSDHAYSTIEKATEDQCFQSKEVLSTDQLQGYEDSLVAAEASYQVNVATLRL